MPRISKLYSYSIQSYWTSLFGKIILYATFAQKWSLPCVTKIMLTEKLFGVGSSNFGFVPLDNNIIRQRTNRIEQDLRTKCVGISENLLI